MAEFSAKRVVAVAALVGALVGGAVAGVVALASTSGNLDGPGSSGAGLSLGTAAVVRTNLSTPVQVGGSIGYTGSYTVVAPSGTSAQQVTQAQQAVTGDEQGLSAAEQAGADAASADRESTAAAEADVGTARSALTSDEAAQVKDCAGKASSSQTCSQDTRQVDADQVQLGQADQQLATAEEASTRDADQDAAQVTSDETRLSDDQAAVSSLQATEVNPGTTYTALPQVGDVIKQDQPVYALSNEPAPLLYGAITAYRAFYVGMPDGADVGELTHDLVALGYGPGLGQSNHYSSATAGAVAAWQRALGLPATGEILLGEVVFEPGPLRVTAVTPSLGGSVAGGGAGGTVLTATSTTPVVTVDLDVSEEYLVKPGDTVAVVLPDGTTTVGGRIETVGDVATCSGGGGVGTAGGGSGGGPGGQSPCSSAGSGSNSSPTVTVTVTLDSTPTLARLDQAPVDVNITTQQVDNVLAAPVNALLALAGGGYGVEVVSGGTARLVGVTTGLYDNTLVQVSGPGITAGTLVQVPSS